MRLLYQSHSPYARKVLVAAHEIGLAGRLEVIHHETSPTLRNSEVFALNPLGKVPVLICDDDTVLFDSSVICEYLDGLHEGRRLFPAEPRLRFMALRHQAMAMGIADAGIAVRWETTRRPEAYRWAPLRDGHLQKIEAAVDFLEAHIGHGHAVDIGDIALATALSWIEFRQILAFRDGRPRLAAWYERISERPSMLATLFAGDTVDAAPNADSTTGGSHALAMA